MRLGSFVPPGTEIVEQSYVEWMDGLSLHEGIGLTWFGRLMAQLDQRNVVLERRLFRVGQRRDRRIELKRLERIQIDRKCCGIHKVLMRWP